MIARTASCGQAPDGRCPCCRSRLREQLAARRELSRRYPMTPEEAGAWHKLMREHRVLGVRAARAIVLRASDAYRRHRAARGLPLFDRPVGDPSCTSCEGAGWFVDAWQEEGIGAVEAARRCECLEARALAGLERLELVLPF